MKLSMWMIANRLASFDPELNIEENAPAVLKSARLAHATNCVYVYPEKNGIVCTGEGGSLRIPNISIAQGFEIIQSVFDYFEDWSELVLQSIRKRDYQQVVDLAWQVFNNPVVLFDGNNKVLGISRQYPEDSLDEEWAYLSRYGYSSLNALQQLKYSYDTMKFLHRGFEFYHAPGQSDVRYGGITYCMYCNEAVCGRMNLLAKERSLNYGDYQLMEYISGFLEPSMGQFYYESKLNNANVLYNLLFGLPFAQGDLEFQMDIQHWNAGGCYQLALIQVNGHQEPQAMDYNLDLLQRLLMQQVAGAAVLRKNNCILLLANRELAKDTMFNRLIASLASSNPIVIGFSLPCQGIQKAGYLYKQAEYAIIRGTAESPDQIVFEFFDYAVDYIIETSSLECCANACIPQVVTLWEMNRSSGDELFQTLKYYLDFDCSISRTSAALFTHRNTVLYRIRKIRDYFNDTLDDIYIKNYCRISIQTLELYKKRGADKTERMSASGTKAAARRR